MLCGPTVRRLHRQRDERRQEERQQRRSSDKKQMPAKRIPVSHRPAGEFPFSMASLLGLDQAYNVVVFGDRIGHIVPHTNDPTARCIEVRGRRRMIHFCSSLTWRLTEAMQQHQATLDRWARGVTTDECSAELDRRGKELSPDVHRQVEQFITGRLIPFLEEQKPSSARGAERAACSSAGDVLASLDRSFAFVDRSWYRLVPFFGTPEPGQFHLRIGDRQFLGTAFQHRKRAMKRYDSILQQAFCRQAMASPDSRHRRGDLYRDADYAVTCTSAGKFFCCRQLSAYAVEGPEGQLYYFDPVEIGVQLTGASTNCVVHPGTARVMHPYFHMFVGDQQAGSPICMPRPEEYYARLEEIPLEEALLQHLDAARLTLCAGYTQNCGPYRLIQHLQRPTITQEKAADRQVPVYRQYSVPLN